MDHIGLAEHVFDKLMLKVTFNLGSASFEVDIHRKPLPSARSQSQRHTYMNRTQPGIEVAPESFAPFSPKSVWLCRCKDWCVPRDPGDQRRGGELRLEKIGGTNPSPHIP